MVIKNVWNETLLALIRKTIYVFLRNLTSLGLQAFKGQVRVNHLTRPSTDEWIKKLWYIYAMESYSAIKRKAFESVLMRWMNLQPIIQNEVNQKEKNKHHTLTYIYGIYKDDTDEPIGRAAMERQT